MDSSTIAGPQSHPTEPKKSTSSVHDHADEKPPFGSRFLTPDKDVWSKNAWDHVPPPDDQHEVISSSLARQRSKPVPEDEKHKYNEKPARHWDNFYKMNNENFFRDRKWLHTEFPELVAATKPDAGPKFIAELGCGAGNSVFPLLTANENPLLKLHACDFSSHAVKLVQHNPLYTNPPMGSISASVWDLTSDSLPEGIAPGSVDIVVLVFVLSALHPREWAKAVANVYKMLKPGGYAVMRDYGRHDMTQLRFKEGRLLDDNFYIRGDKTRVYFFELATPSQRDSGSAETVLEVEEAETEEVADSSAPATASPEPLSADSDEKEALSITPPEGVLHPILLDPLTNVPPGCPAHPLFLVEQLGVDRRLLVNRKRQIKMYRVWMQGKFKKL
ncbi:methyltransferase [Schizopora paradoxa]|uniref:tRNA N(3)-methylcytidine methyltransferase n=1 Tax=Schizopora paradoxa TaxID=27342 RepID=A0A0H2S5Q0_9AGAM|nr:methyltransferase [Schizopora paradoxa]